jgi:hypothetical protein
MYLDDEALALEFVLLAESRELRRVTALSRVFSQADAETNVRGYSRGAFMSFPGSLRSFELLLQ